MEGQVSPTTLIFFTSPPRTLVSLISYDGSSYPQIDEIETIASISQNTSRNGVGIREADLPGVTHSRQKPKYSVVDQFPGAAIK